VFLRFEKSFLDMINDMINAAINPNIPAQSSPGTTAFSVLSSGRKW